MAVETQSQAAVANSRTKALTGAERSKRWRDRRKERAAVSNRRPVGLLAATNLNPAGFDPHSNGRSVPASSGNENARSSSPRISTTTPLGRGAVDPARWSGVPPIAVDAPPEPPKPGEPTAEESAAAFASTIALLTKLAIADARVHYAPELAALPIPVDEDQVAAIVYKSAERVAIKYGFNFRVPFQDELVTAGAGIGSVLYLWARKTGRLERDHSDTPAGAANRRPPDMHSPAPAGDVDHDDQEHDDPWNSAPVPRNQNERIASVKGIPGH